MAESRTEGFDDFEALLIEMGKDFGYRETTRNVLTKSAKAAMETTLLPAKSMARSNTGRMRETIKVESRIPNNRDRKSSYVHQDDAVIGILSVKQSAISLGEEFGTSKKSGHPFLRPALESNQEQVLRRLSSALAFTLDAYKSRKMKGK
jgi:HK97 gp10 family phage protein